MNHLFTENSPDTYDAIVVGSGISGGWAAKELCEKGLKTLVLERGRNVRHVVDYTTANMDPWDFKPEDKKLTPEVVERDYKVQSRFGGYVMNEAYIHFFVKDSEHPYEEAEGKRFDWIRGYQVGGRSLMWGRQSYRWSPMDFEANAKEGIGIDWPIRYKDIAKWYDYVEAHIGVSGMKEGLPQLPDGIFQPPMDFNCVEEVLRDNIAKNFDDRMMTIGRVAHITDPKGLNGRGTCQFRNRCMRGCPYGAYFSSQSSTLSAAEATGNLTLRPDSIVYEVVYDEDKKRASGVRVIDSKTKKDYFFKAKVIFLNASTVHSTKILMMSKSNRFPEGIGAESGQLGHNMMDHQLGAGASGEFEGFEDKYYKGRRPNGIYIPRFRNLPGRPETKTDFLRGYGYQGGASRQNWMRNVAELGFGAEYKDEMYEPGMWTFGMGGFGEILPYHDNRMELTDKKDAWGLPIIKFHTELKENDIKMRKDIIDSAVEILEKAGLKNVNGYDGSYGVGKGIHEMGTARMGHDPKDSVLNKWNQVHQVPNLFNTDGACMTSAACQNPSLTYMALTARAANYAAEQLAKGKL